jgi:ubiquinone biosynthesis protein COQ4
VEEEERGFRYGSGGLLDDATATSAPRSALGRVRLLLEHAAVALGDPTRADAVAAVGELTGPVALQRLLEHMRSDPDGQRILHERPIVSKDTIPYDALVASSSAGATPPISSADGRALDSSSSSGITFGQAYGSYLATNGFDPDGRDPVRYVSDPDLAYVMLRYRQCHDYWHALTGLAPTVAGELGLKWLELFQTGLPLPALSSTVASLVQLDSHHRRVVWDVYLPWAYRTSKHMRFGSLMTVYYEKEFDTPLHELRARLGIIPAPDSVERL